ncbi:hypothetical protein [Acinetobacter venetianus]|uniref:hypothetical protein n=1 Tax=Acinetobacter venetianus TaxID=52133 RepID=UPI0007786773|nr:hypothetical protein [Acinetobacter venetianus]KXZ66833.1 hypothetical protein AVENLUH7437_00647 [Acinetobacter venetianus]
MSDQIFIAAISAGGVLLGVALSQVITLLNARLTRKHEKQTVLREKYEKLADDLNTALSRIPLFDTASQIDRLETIKLCRSVYSLSLVYFSELRPTAEDFLIKLLDFHRDVINGGDHKQSAKAFQASRIKLENAISEHSKIYT